MRSAHSIHMMTRPYVRIFVYSRAIYVDIATAKRLDKYIFTAKLSPSKCLSFVSLESSYLRAAVFAVASFACNVDLSSQLGFIVTRTDARNSAKSFQCSRFKSKRITSSLFAAELFAVIHAFDYASIVFFPFNEIMARNIPLLIFMDSRRLFKGLVGFN